MLFVVPLHFWVKDHRAKEICYEEKCSVTSEHVCTICDFDFYITSACSSNDILLKRIDRLLFVRAMGIKKVVVRVTNVYISLRAPPFLLSLKNS